jgi:hypothetical protein
MASAARWFPWLWSTRAHVQELGGDGGKEMELDEISWGRIFVYSRLLDAALAGLAIRFGPVYLECAWDLVESMLSWVGSMTGLTWLVGRILGVMDQCVYHLR